ncbi:MAG TPA: FAD-binding oxidoreductase [Nitrospiria bacterium]|nr:FAD-binding oxidoreductase [Nitrospiria bacterium]
MAEPAARPEPFKHYRVTVERIVPMTPTVKSYTLALQDDARIRFKPGQYVQLHVPKGEGTVAKPYSIASPPDHEREIELCIKRVEGGYVSNYCDGLVGGESFEIQGPIGKFHLQEPVDSDLAFLATGTGVAPFRSMLRGLFPTDPGQTPWAPYRFRADRHVWLIFGVRSEEEILYEQEFRLMAERYPTFHFIPTVSRPKRWAGASGYVQDQAVRLLREQGNLHVYVCGLLPMIEGVRAALKGVGFKREQIHYEIYT